MLKNYNISSVAKAYNNIMNAILNVVVLTAIASISPARLAAAAMPAAPTPTGSSKIDAYVYKTLNPATTSPVKIIDNPDGYTYYYLSVYKAPFTTLSNLYLVEVELWFTPGDQPASNGYSQYTSGTKLGKGSVSLEIIRYVDDKYCYGGDVAVKTFWPQSNSFTYTVSSSFGGSISASSSWQGKVGVSYDSGDSATISASESITDEVSATLSWNHSTSIITQDPVVSAQYAPDSTNKVFFTYQVLEPSVAGSVTYHMDTFVLFEMKTNHRNCGPDSFQLGLNVSTQDYWYKNSWFVHEWRLGDVYQYSDTLDCQVKDNFI